MRTILFLLSAAAISFLTACNETASTGGGMSDTAKKNLEAFHTVSNAFSTGDTSKIDDVVASDFVDHTERGDKIGPDSLKAMISMMSKSVSNMKVETKKEFADDDYVIGWLRWTGTTDGSMGMPAGPVDMDGVEVVRFKDGKAVEHWAFMNAAEMMKMMSNMPQHPSPSSATPTSTDKKQ